MHYLKMDISAYPELDLLQQQAWQAFSEQAPEITQQLTDSQILISKQAFMMSDFVFEQIQANPEWLIELLAFDFSSEIDFKEIVDKALIDCKSEEQLSKVLRLIRNKYLVGMAIADLTQQVELPTSLLNLSNMADNLIDGARNWLTHLCHDLWGQPQNSEGEVQPLLVFAMGKLGGQELNFSSDIDLIFCYPESGETVGKRRALDNQQFFTRLGQKLISALNQITVDGFVYRVDMRLRPFGDSGPLVMNFSSLENYYQDQGRDWERYAMLKARLVGSNAYHHELVKMLKPFVYRRYIDFSVIESFRRMKLMITQEARRKQLHYNIKLGVGGIREVEFIAQVFQLIRGGRIPELQERGLLKALKLLHKYESISKESLQVLSDAYCFLRRSENAIQAFNDKQTQQLPDEQRNQARLALVMGFYSWSDFLSACESQMHSVNQEFALLVGEENDQSQNAQPHWLTYWLAAWPDDESITWLNQQQPQWPALAIHTAFKHFKTDLNKRNIGPRGRTIIDKLIPVFIGLLEKEQQPLLTLERTLLVLAKIITRTAYLELLYENAPAFKQLLSLCRSSSWIAEHLAKFPILLDELIDPKLLYAIPPLERYQIKLIEALIRIPEDDLEAQMEGLRQYKQAKQLKIAAADVTGILPVMKVSDHLTALAQAIINEVVNMAWQQMLQRYGQPSNTLGTDDKCFGVIGYGKLGGIELGYGSDLDLVFIHNSDKTDVTNGSKPISAFQFYLKLAQRILHLFNTRTSNGILYEADMRLRPSGSSGAMVVHVDTFAQYQQQEAWTWEHQALVRSRFICGDAVLKQQFEQIRLETLSIERVPSTLVTDVVKMREKMREHLDKTSSAEVDIKQGSGGLADIEFLCQYLVLQHCHRFPKLATFSDNVRIFEQLLALNIINEHEQQVLTKCYCDLRDLGHAQVLQNADPLIDPQTLLVEREQVSQIWQKYLLQDKSGNN